jgi:hypothetical protein
MAGTVTVTEELAGPVKKVKFVWVSDAAGAADGSTSNTYNGSCMRLVTVPGAAGLAPTDNYDVRILDDDSTDVLMAAGVDRDTANTEQVLGTSLGVVANDKLTLAVTGAGDSNGGTVYLYIR